VPHADDLQKRAYFIADNKLALNAGWDNDLLKLEFGALGFDLALTGFAFPEIGMIFAERTASQRRSPLLPRLIAA